jgi:hypothetical protein
VGLDGLGEPFDERAEVFVENAVSAQESIEAIAIAYGAESSAEEDPIEARQNAENATLMSLQETLHVAPPKDGVEQYHHPESGVERHFETSLFGCGRKAALGSLYYYPRESFFLRRVFEQRL